MTLPIIRSDTYKITFGLKMADGTEYVLRDSDKLYFTVKKSFYNNNVVLQKTYGNGITFNKEKKLYEILLSQDDTNIECSTYVFDIKLVINSSTPRVVKTLIKETLKVDPNVTHKENEK